MILILSAIKTLVTGVIMLCVGLAFLPHLIGTCLTSLQKFLSEEIERRERASR